MTQDRFTNTPEDAGRHEARRGQDNDPDERPTRLEADRDDDWRGMEDIETKGRL